MPRVMLKPQSHYPVTVTLEVRVSDLNYGAHLGYDRLLTLAHDARLKLFNQLSVTEMDLGDGTTGIIAADVAISYRGEAFLHDPLLFELKPIEVGLGSFRLAHRVTNLRTQNLAALLEVGFAAFDYKSRKPARLPESFKDKLENLADELEEVDAL